MTNVKRIYVAATARNDGKTTVSVGLISVLRDRLKGVGFIKPVGQRYQVVDGAQVDEDSVLIARLWGAETGLKDMSPIAIARGYTKQYIDGGDNEALRRGITEAFERVAGRNELVVIEGTGHAGVGSVMGLSNAQVARLLRSRVVLVTEGGIGRPVDEILLNKALFDSQGVPVAGVVINKVIPEKYDETVHYVTKSLATNGIRMLGFIPHEPMLATSTVGQVWEGLGGEVLCGSDYMDTRVEHILVGAMSPHRMLDYLTRPHTLLITPSDREDIILTALIASTTSEQPAGDICGIVLTGGERPHDSVLQVLRHADLPVILMEADTYTVASDIHDHIVKMQPGDVDKIALARDLARKYLDLDAILGAATPLPD